MAGWRGDTTNTGGAPNTTRNTPPGAPTVAPAANGRNAMWNTALGTPSSGQQPPASSGSAYNAILSQAAPTPSPAYAGLFGGGGGTLGGAASSAPAAGAGIGRAVNGNSPSQWNTGALGGHPGSFPSQQPAAPAPMSNPLAGNISRDDPTNQSTQWGQSTNMNIGRPQFADAAWYQGLGGTPPSGAAPTNPYGLGGQGPQWNSSALGGYAPGGRPMNAPPPAPAAAPAAPPPAAGGGGQQVQNNGGVLSGLGIKSVQPGQIGNGNAFWNSVSNAGQPK